MINAENMDRSNYKRLGDYIRSVDVRNRDLAVTNLLGVSISKTFIPSIANTIGTDMSTYKVVEPYQFAYGPVTSRNGDKITFALYKGTEKCIISQAYETFEIVDKEQLDPDYLMMWALRPEFDRYARFKSNGSAREIFSWDEMCEVYLPVPDIATQRRIVKEYQNIQGRISSNQRSIQLALDAIIALHKESFGAVTDVQANPNGWNKTSLGEIADFISRGMTPKYDDNSNEVILGQTCVRNGIVTLANARTHKVGPKNEKRIFKEDILINSTGEGSLGRVGIVLFDCPNVSFDTHITVVRTADKDMQNYIAYNLIQRQSEIEEMAEGSTGQTELPRDTVRKIEVLLPPHELIKEFARRSRIISSIIYPLVRENSCLNSMMQLLLAKMS